MMLHQPKNGYGNKVTTNLPEDSGEEELPETVMQQNGTQLVSTINMHLKVFFMQSITLSIVYSI